MVLCLAEGFLGGLNGSLIQKLLDWLNGLVEWFFWLAEWFLGKLNGSLVQKFLDWLNGSLVG